MSTNSSVFFKTCLQKGVLILSIFLYSVVSAYAADPKEGETIFKANCTSCHAMGKRVVGPALKDIHKQREEAWLVKWIHDSQSMVKAGDPEAVRIFNEYNQQVMTSFPQLTEDNVKSIILYMAQESEALDKIALTAPAGGAAEGGSSNTGISILGLLVLAGTLVAVVLVLNRVIKTMEKLVADKKGGTHSMVSTSGMTIEEDDDDEQGVKEPSKALALIKSLACNKKFIALAIVGAAVIGSVGAWDMMWHVGVQQDYQPKQPIMFSHKVHAGVNQIDCQYCHSGAWKSKNASIPSANVCMNCHSQINEYKGEPIFTADGEKVDGTAEIHKIYEALDYDVNTQTYGPNQRPIEWVRVHNLPDFAYYNHSQHVKVGEEAIRAAKGLKAEEPVCYACHGEVAKMDEVFQASQLTMHWCIDCHRSTEMKHAPTNHYYDDMVVLHERIKKGEKVTVAEMGGLECSKCHY